MKQYVPLRIVPLDLREANDMVERLHRHHKPVVGHRFSLAVVGEDGSLHGAAIVGRPVARGAGHKRSVVEVCRLVTDGTPNACSMLYGACARVAKAMGFYKIQTYILEGEEPGTSLRASGWIKEAVTAGGQWTGTNGRPRRTDQPTCPKARWAKILGTPNPENLSTGSPMRELLESIL